jgi:hypothetical protein
MRPEKIVGLVFLTAVLGPRGVPSADGGEWTPLSPLLGWFIYWMVTKDLVYARYLRVVDRANAKIVIVKYMAILGEGRSKYKVKGGRFTNTHQALVEAGQRGEIPEPNNLSGDVFHLTHWGDWRRAIKDNGDSTFAHASGNNCMLEFDYGKDVVAERVVVKTANPEGPAGLWVELWNDEMVKVYEFQLKAESNYDLKVKPIEVDTE